MIKKTEESESWVDIHDWLGVEDPTWSPKKVKELLKDLIKSGFIFKVDEAVLYSFLLRKGVLNLANRHGDFFKNLIRASRTSGGKKAIEQYATSDSKIPPDLSVYKGAQSPVTEEEKIENANTFELHDLTKDSELFDFEKYESVQQILKDTEVLESISVDDEAMQFYLAYCINRLWKDAFINEKKLVEGIKKHGKSDNKFRNVVVSSFLRDYEGAKNLKIPQGYSFPDEPFLMQKYAAYKIKKLPYFGNFSGTGAGKTLASILSSRVIDSKMSLIVCPNDVVNHWKKYISEIFPDSVIITGKEVFDARYDESKYQYLVLNYDKLNQPDSPNLILKLVKQKIDLVILDEIHFSKITRDESISKRRKNLDGLMTVARKKNKNIKVLGLSATPVVNNLVEGRSLLELITGKRYDDISTKPTVPNAVTLFEKLTTVSVRQKPIYPEPIKQTVEVDAQKPDNISLAALHKRPLAIEQFLTNARIPEIIKRINGQTIIYTEYVGSSFPKLPTILDKLCDAVNDAGYTFGLYVGEDHSGLERFLKKKIQVLIASRPISTGIDGLQHVCSNLIFNTLPWTHALYQQIIGRIVRTGMGDNSVSIHHIIASIGGFPYDQMKLDRLKFKRTLAECAVDGLLPERNLVTPQQATREAINWLQRLERGEISCITRRELDVQLTPVEIKKRLRTFGDFTRLNQKINTEKSQTTHQRLLKNPTEWHEYHRQYREERKDWRVVPYKEWIKRIKRLSDRFIIGDFGCGEAKIGEIFGSRVKSFDHVAIDPNVFSCDIKDVFEYVKDGGLDVALFSLSLMGKNWEEYLKEASRCLKEQGLLFITETTNSLSKRLANLRDVIKQNGFEIYRDEEIGLFTFFEARKLENSGE